ncbi:OmpA family protein [Portibacter marinus]|uniref:OmpA family protein n=1 Tax=Portibacter marinus TaxID=2898660 RepID=UPI001F2352E5|nr:OmpA family protein [Portibacter marinus]
MRIVFCLFLSLLFFFVNGQGEFRLERVKTIPANATVKDILVHQNHIYIASNVGLFKIDGKNLETRLLSKSPIDALCHVGNDEIWASVNNRFLQNMRTGETTNYNAPGIQIRDIDYSKGKIWIATNQGILTVLTRTNEMGKIEYDKKSGLPSNNVAFIHIDKQKQMWIGTDQGIVFINKKDKWKTYEKKLSMEAMHYNHEGLWLVSDQEMWVVDDFNRWYPAAIDRGLRKGRIRDITADSTGRLYMASDILVRYDPYDETIESYAENTAIVSKVCNAVESDRDNRIWLGTEGGGLFLFGYADEARNVQELIASRDRKIEEANRNGMPLVTEQIVEPIGQATFASIEETVTEDNTTLAAEINSDSGEGSTLEEQQDIAIEKVAEDPLVEGRTEVEEQERNQAESKIETAKLNVTSRIKNEIACSGDLAEVSLDIAGGKGPYQIEWNNEKGASRDVSLPAGQYQYTVVDANGQSASSSLSIEGKPALQMKIISRKSPSALSRKDGNVKIDVIGGTAPYIITWSNGETGDRARRLEDGLVNIKVVDANGCVLEEEIEMKAKIMADLSIDRVTVGQKLEIKNIYYEADSTDITLDSYESLDEVYEFLLENDHVKIEIGGHTNSIPSHAYCDRISTARAKSVADYLYDKGIPEDRISYKGYGKRQPIASNETKEGRRRNQRVEIEIISK